MLEAAREVAFVFQSESCSSPLLFVFTSLSLPVTESQRKTLGPRDDNDLKLVIVCIFLGIPRIHKLDIEGRGFHTNLYAVGKEGKSRIQWLRSMVGSPDLISIPGTLNL
ncbi:hypothetical protein RIF29_09412 [Crotalaria pallida]|uniref:Uncharacterized protein n=1 Tax=Crotalaria pallida TaxID=3830 RepID=A0AAN9FY61_CROPI